MKWARFHRLNCIASGYTRMQFITLISDKNITHKCEMVSYLEIVN